jgi:putative NIF3 family GTP cyclohydrolase 1 type 2
LKLGADVMVTGDVRYHAAQEANIMRMPVIDAGHFGLEKCAPHLLAQSFMKELIEMGLDIRCTIYDGETEPFQHVSSPSGG